MISKHLKVWQILAQWLLAGVKRGLCRTQKASQESLGKGLWWELLQSQGHGATTRQANLLNFRGEDIQLVFLEGHVRSSLCVSNQPGNCFARRSRLLSFCVGRDSDFRIPFQSQNCPFLYVLFLFFVFFFATAAVSKGTVLPFFWWIVFFLPEDIWKHPPLWVLLSWLYYKDTSAKVHRVMCWSKWKTNKQKNFVGNVVRNKPQGEKITSGITQHFEVSTCKSQGELVSFLHPRVCVGVGIRSFENFRVISHNFTIFILTFWFERL